jgi:hypothetical protein
MKLTGEGGWKEMIRYDEDDVCCEDEEDRHGRMIGY